MTDDKTCSACGETKPFSEFYKNRDGKFGLTSKCAECVRADVARYRERNPERTKETARKYRDANCDAIAAKSKAWRDQNPERVKELNAAAYDRNKAARHEYALRWRDANPDRWREIRRGIYERRKATAKGKLEHNVRANLFNGITKGSKRGRRTFDLLGYTVEELRSHLEAKFLDGMTWENYGPVWHIDHVLPLASFDYSTPDCHEFKRAWALTNLQPLWARENISKGDRLDHPSQIALLAA